MSKHKFSRRKFIGKQKTRIIDPTPEEFVQAVQVAEKIVIASIAEKRPTLTASEVTVFLALCTKAALVGSSEFQMSLREIQETIFHILDEPGYIPGPDFPYTKKQMLEAGRDER